MGARLPILLAGAYLVHGEANLSTDLMDIWENIVFPELDVGIEQGLLISQVDKDGIGNTEIFDYSANADHGTLNEALTPARQVNIGPTRGISFDGIDDNIDLGNTGNSTAPAAGDHAFQSTDDFTIALAISTSETGQQADYGLPIVGRNNADVGAQLSLHQGFVQYNREDTTWKTNIQSHKKVNDGKLHTVVFVNDGATETATLYIDGEIQSYTGSNSSVIGGGKYFMLDTLMAGYNASFTEGAIYDYRVYTDEKDQDFATKYDGYVKSNGASVNGGQTGLSTVTAGDITTSLMCGALKDTSFRVTAEMRERRIDCQLVVSVNSNLSSPAVITSSATPKDLFVKDRTGSVTLRYYVNFEVTGLTADTQYYYALKSDQANDSNNIAQVKTAPAELTEPSALSSQLIGLVSCSNLFGPYSATAVMPVYTALAAETPLMVIHMGDFGYMDGAGNWLNDGGDIATTPFDDIQLHRGFLRFHINSANFQTLARKCAIVIMFDDHEIIDDYHIAEDNIGPAIRNLYQAYDEMIPHYDFINQTDSWIKGLQQEWYIGRTHYLMPDEKYQNSNDSLTDVTKLGDGGLVACDNSVVPSGSFTSFNQLQWLKDRLLAAKIAGAIKSRIVNAASWERDSVDGWSSIAYIKEQKEISQYVVDNDLAEVEILFGDSHRAEIDDGQTFNKPLLENATDGQFIAIGSGAAHSTKYFSTDFSQWNGVETTGHPQANGGVYRWVDSPTTPNEYYIELIGGGDPKLPEPELVKQGTNNVNHVDQSKGTLGSLAEGEWDFGDQDTLGFDTVYYRASGDVDPDTLYMLFMYLRCYVTVSDEDDTGNVRVISDFRHKDSAGDLIRDAVYRTDDVTPTISVKDSSLDITGSVGTVNVTIQKTWLGPWSCSYATANRTAVAGDYPSEGTVSVGTAPTVMAVNETTNKIYVVNSSSASVSVISGSTGLVTSTISVGTFPLGVAVNETTNTIYVGNSTDDTLSVIDGSTDTVTTTISLTSGDDPRGVAVNETTNQVYVANADLDTVTVINGATNLVTNIISGVSDFPIDIAVDEANNKLYVICHDNANVTIIDGATGIIEGHVNIVKNPTTVKIDTTNNRLFIGHEFDDVITEVSTLDHTTTQNITVGDRPRSIDINVAGDRLYVANFADDTVSVINLSTSAVVKTISMAGGVDPNGIVVNTTTSKLYVSHQTTGEVETFDARDDYTNTSGTLTPAQGANANSQEAVISIPITNISSGSPRSFYLNISSASTGTQLGESQTIIYIDGPESIANWDALVDGVGAGADEYATIDAAILSSNKTIWVKQGTYDEDLTFDIAGQHIYFEPGTIIDDGAGSSGLITVSAEEVILDFGAACVVDGLVTWSGVDGTIKGRNNVSFASGITITGDRFHSDGGGLKTEFADIISISSASEVFLLNISIDTKTGTTGNHALAITGADSDRIKLHGLLINDSDSVGLNNSSSSAQDHLISGCMFLGSDSSGFNIRNTRNIIIGNSLSGSGGVGINTSSANDNNIISANMIRDQGTGDAAINIDAGAEDCVVVGNRVDDLGTSDGINDASGTSIVGANNETAF